MKTLVITMLLFLSGTCFASDPGDTSTDLWNTILQTHVNANGDVNYTALKKDPNFDKVLTSFAKELPKASWTKYEKMAYWMNVYNAYTLKLIVDNLPLKSITDLKEPWDQKFIVLENRSFSLNQIEHEILRKEFQDPRIHFGINCASISCPVLHNKAFYAENVNATLEMLTARFINDKSRNTISSSKLSISSMFDWFKEDFTKGQSLIAFLNKYSKTSINADASIDYQSYNWNLNGK